MNFWVWAVVLAFLSRFEGVLGLVDTFLTALTPSKAVECSQTNFTWFGGTPPYAISLLANDTNGYRALGFANIATTSFITKLPFAAGQWLELLISDAEGGEAVSSPFRVMSNNGSSGSCALTATPVIQNSITGNSTLNITSPTPLDSLSVCDSSFTVNWQGGQPPYNLLLQTMNTSVLMEQAYGGPMMDGGSINTRVQIPPGFDFQVIVTDSVGTTATTGRITLANGGETDCVIQSDATDAIGAASGSSFHVSGNANASAILLPTPTQQALVSPTPSAAESSAAADLKPKAKSFSTKTVTIVASALGVTFVGLLVATLSLYRNRMRNRRKPRLDLLNGAWRSSKDAERAHPVDTDVEKYRPEPYRLPAVPQRGAAAPQRTPTEPSQSYYAGATTPAPMREYHPPQKPWVVTNPDADTRSLVPPYSAGSRYQADEGLDFNDEKYELDPTRHSTYDVVGLTWEDEKPMLR